MYSIIGKQEFWEMVVFMAVIIIFSIVIAGSLLCFAAKCSESENGDRK